MAAFETHIDDEALATGTHQGADGASALYVPGYDFRMYGVMVGLAIHNDTQSTDGLVTIVANQYVTDDTNTWDNGDTYSIYKTAAKNTQISRIATDMSRGWKVTSPDELDAETGWFREDLDEVYIRTRAAVTGIPTDAEVLFHDSEDVWWWTGFMQDD